MERLSPEDASWYDPDMLAQDDDEQSEQPIPTVERPKGGRPESDFVGPYIVQENTWDEGPIRRWKQPE